MLLLGARRVISEVLIRSPIQVQVEVVVVLAAGLYPWRVRAASLTQLLLRALMLLHHSAGARFFLDRLILALSLFEA